MEYTPERAIALTLEIYGDSSPSSAAWDIITCAGRTFRPEEYMPFVPPKLVEALQEQVKNLPARHQDLCFFTSSVYSAKYFEGLTEEEAQAKVALEKEERKKEVFNAMHALHEYLRNRDA